jgi:hypothetical protein
MKLEEFLESYDFEGSIVLLEGKRNVIESDKEKLIKLGELLTVKSKFIKFRSGNADGADFYFAKGVTSIDSSRFEVIVPYSGHRKKENHAYSTISLDNIDLANEPEVVYQSKRNHKTEKLIDKFVDGESNRVTIKAAYIIRDTIKVIGTSEVRPANFAIFYEDFSNPNTGGTGHTMDICKENGVKFIDQSVWGEWV